MTQQRADYPLDYTAAKAKNGIARAETMADMAADHLENAAQSAQEIAGKVADQAKIYGEKAQEAAQNIRPYVEKSMKEHRCKPLLWPQSSALYWALSGRGKPKRRPPWPNRSSSPSRTSSARTKPCAA